MFYGLIKKGISLSSDVVMLFGDRFILPVSLVYFLAFSTVNLLEVLLFKDVLLILSGAVTVILLLFFSSTVPGAVSSS